MPKPKAKDKPSTRAPVGSGMVAKAKEWLLGRSGKVDAKVESAQKGRKRGDGWGKDVKPSKSDGPLVKKGGRGEGWVKNSGKKAEMPMDPKKKKAIEDAVQEAKDREMDKNMAKGYNKAKKAPLW